MELLSSSDVAVISDLAGALLVQGHLLRTIDVSAGVLVGRNELAAGVYIYSLVVDGTSLTAKRLVGN